MSEELEKARQLIDDLVGLKSFTVVQLPCETAGIRLYGAQALKSMTIGTHPVVIADKDGVRYLDHKDWAPAWEYASKHGVESITKAAFLDMLERMGGGRHARL